MLQSGVATRDLDVRWVSSLSWYFLNLFGLQSVFIFLLGNENGTPRPTLLLSFPFAYRCNLTSNIQRQAKWLSKCPR